MSDPITTFISYGLSTPLSQLLEKNLRYRALSKREKRDLQDFILHKHMEISKMCGGAKHDYIQARDALRWNFDSTTLTNHESDSVREVNTFGARVLKKITSTFYKSNSKPNQSKYQAARIYESLKSGVDSLKAKTLNLTFGTAVLLLLAASLISSEPASGPSSANIATSIVHWQAGFFYFWGIVIATITSIRFTITSLFNYSTYNSKTFFDKDFFKTLGTPYINDYLDKILDTYQQFIQDKNTSIYRYEKLDALLNDHDYFERLRYDPEHDEFFVMPSENNKTTESTQQSGTTSSKANISAAALDAFSYKPSITSMRNWAKSHPQLFSDPTNFMELERQRRILRAMNLWDTGHDQVMAHSHYDSIAIQQLLRQKATQAQKDAQLLAQQKEDTQVNIYTGPYNRESYTENSLKNSAQLENPETEHKSDNISAQYNTTPAANESHDIPNKHNNVVRELQSVAPANSAKQKYLYHK